MTDAENAATAAYNAALGVVESGGSAALAAYDAARCADGGRRINQGRPTVPPQRYRQDVKEAAAAT